MTSSFGLKTFAKCWTSIGSTRPSLLLILDQNFPRPVARALICHTFKTANGMGWAELENGDLLAAAEAAGFALMLTADRRIRYQQNLAGRMISLVVTTLNSRTVLLRHVGLIQAAVDRAVPGSYEEVAIPPPVLLRRPWPGGPGRDEAPE